MTDVSRVARRAVMWMALLALPVAAWAQDFAAHALRGMGRISVAVDGVDKDFARYGLRADELRAYVEQRLGAAGITVVDDAAAQSAAGVGQVRVKLRAVQSSYAFYSYALALEARRKLELADGNGFISQKVWSTGQTGVLNPSDLRRLYDVLDGLLTAFIAAHGADNVGGASS